MSESTQNVRNWKTGPFTNDPKECWDFYEGDGLRLGEEIPDRPVGRQRLAIQEWLRLKETLYCIDDDQWNRRDVCKEIGKTVFRMKHKHEINKATGILFWVATVIRPLDELHPVASKILVELIFFLAVVDLHYECYIHRKYQGIVGYPHGPRTLFEVENDLVDSQSRADFTRYWMIQFGLIKNSKKR